MHTVRSCSRWTVVSNVILIHDTILTLSTFTCFLIFKTTLSMKKALITTGEVITKADTGLFIRWTLEHFFSRFCYGSRYDDC